MSQRTKLLEPLRDITQDRGNSYQLAMLVPNQNDGELDRYPMTVLPHCGDGEHIAFAIPAPPGLHGVVVALPVPLPQPLWNDDVERLPERLRRPGSPC